MRKIYFCGAIRGGRQDADLYQEIITHIQKTDIVLTEHIGDLSKDPFKDAIDRDSAVYTQDTAWLKESDLVIAECTMPSLGVGYELGLAESLNKEVHVFYRINETYLSSMIKGNPHYHIHAYTNKKELFDEIDKILS